MGRGDKACHRHGSVHGECSMVVSRHIHINVPVERVFALISDPLERARLNPHAAPIRVEIEGEPRLQNGSVCHYRLQVERHIVDYRTRVCEFIPNRRITSVSDSTVPLEITLDTEPEDGGTRLTQTEKFEPTDDMLLEGIPADPALRFLVWLLPFLDLDYARRVLDRREELLRKRLENNLDNWLAAIKRDLEGRPT
jgi:uncharacterized protein YndB with AHSA1/START domain